MAKRMWRRRNKEYEANINKYRMDNYLTWNELSQRLDISIGSLFRLSNGSVSPLTQGNNITKSARKICQFFNVDFEDMFPRYFCKITGPDNSEMVSLTSCKTETYDMKINIYGKTKVLRKCFQAAKKIDPIKYRLFIRHYILGEPSTVLGRKYGMSKQGFLQKIKPVKLAFIQEYSKYF